MEIKRRPIVIHDAYLPDFFPVIPLIQHPICGEPRLGAGIDEHLVDGVHGVKVYDDVERRGVPAVLVLAPERGVILVRGVWVAVLEEDVPLGLVHHPAYRADGPVRVGEIIPELGDDVPFRQVDTVGPRHVLAADRAEVHGIRGPGYVFHPEIHLDGFQVYVILPVRDETRYRRSLQRPGILGRRDGRDLAESRPHFRVVGVHEVVGVSHVVFGSPVVDVIRVRGGPLHRAGGAVRVDHMEVLDLLRAGIGLVPDDGARVDIDIFPDTVVIQYSYRIAIERQVYGASHRVAQHDLPEAALVDHDLPA